MTTVDNILKLQSNYDYALYQYLKHTDYSGLEQDFIRCQKENKTYAFLRILIKADLDVKKYFIDPVLDLALFGSENTIGIARDFIVSIAYDSFLKESLYNKVDSLIQNYNIEKGYEYFYFRNAAQLFYELRFDNELRSFLSKYCKNSTDSNVKEIYDDYWES